MKHVLIMAGGKSSRMRKSNNQDTHKALLKVHDIPLIDLNILYAYIYGFNQIWVSISKNEEELLNHVYNLKASLVKKLNIDIFVIIENIPLGTIGSASLVDCEDEDLLVLNVDNVLGLDLKELMDAHKESEAKMTIASHEEEFMMPFGELVVQDRIITNYLEKPIKKILISSGTYILSPFAINLIRGEYLNIKIDIPQLCNKLIEMNFKLTSFHHHSLWTDINDLETLQKANHLEKWPILESVTEFRNQLNNP